MSAGSAPLGLPRKIVPGVGQLRVHHALLVWASDRHSPALALHLLPRARRMLRCLIALFTQSSFNATGIRAHVLSLYRHPKLVDLSTGEVVHVWSELQSGLQVASIMLGVDGEAKPPPMAFDPALKRFAIRERRHRHPDRVQTFRGRCGVVAIHGCRLRQRPSLSRSVLSNNSCYVSAMPGIGQATLENKVPKSARYALSNEHDIHFCFGSQSA